MNKHLVFYDGQCGLCDHIVQCILRLDTQKIFIFAPLQGQTAEHELKNLPNDLKNIDSLILLENYQKPNQKQYVLAKGALRICWLLGGFWCLFGWLSFLPGFLFNWAYRLVARNRHRFFRKNVCVVPDSSNEGRFLP